jgi:hypothetical protein|tara:strand:- start:175 stop:627 length:453 start_codon:yes stop_codon:yes gene_type:complete
MGFRGIQSTNIISTDVGLTDPLLILNKSGTTAVDVGFLGKIGSVTYAGLVKDSATDEFLLINSVELSPNTVNDVNALDSSIVKGNLSAGDITADEITINTTFVHPKGTAAQRPASPVAGQTWFNTDTSLFEGYDGTGWIQFIPSTYVYIP